MINADAYALGAGRSAIRELFAYGRERAAQVGEEHIFDFSLGNPSIPSPAGLTEALRQVVAQSDPLQLHGYTAAGGDPEARRAIARDLNERFQAGAREEELFLTCGAAPALTAVLGALAVSGGRVVAIAPYFPEYGPFVRQAGMTLDVVPPDVPDFQINFPALEALLTAQTVALILNCPNNPSGVVYSRRTLERLSKLLGEKSRQLGRPIYLISDEPYRELVYGDARVSWLPHIYPNTVVCYSYSKSLSIPGERIGYVYVPSGAHRAGELIAAVAGAARGMGHVCAPSLWQKVIAQCTHLRPDLVSYDRNRRTLCQGLRELGYELAQPDGAFYLFVKAPGGDANAFSQRAKAMDLLLVSGDSFGCPGYFRLCYCVSYEKILGSLPLFRRLMEE